MPSFENLLTENEKERVRKRLKILKLLKSGLTVREVAKHLKVSTATVVKTKKRFDKKKQKRRASKNLNLSSKTAARRWVWG